MNMVYGSQINVGKAAITYDLFCSIARACNVEKNIRVSIDENAMKCNAHRIWGYTLCNCWRSTYSIVNTSSIALRDAGCL